MPVFSVTPHNDDVKAKYTSTRLGYVTSLFYKCLQISSRCVPASLISQSVDSFSIGHNNCSKLETRENTSIVVNSFFLTTPNKQENFRLNLT